MLPRLQAVLGYAGVRLLAPLALAIVIATVWVATLERVRYERKETVADALRQKANLALAFEAHTLSTLRAVDHTLVSLLHEYRAHGVKTDPREFAGAVMDFSLVVSGGVADARGDFVVTLRPQERPVNIADREHFLYHRASLDPRMSVGKPVMARLAGKPIVPLSRRVTLGDGSFGGIATIALDAEYFASFYSKIELDPGSMILLVGLDGIVRARRAGPQFAGGASIEGSPLHRRILESESGSFEGEGRVDGVRRYMSYRRVAGFPLAVVVGTSVDSALASVEDRAQNYRLLAAAATLLLLIVAGVLLYADWRQGRAAAEVERSEARYRAAFDQAAIGIAHAALDGTLTKVNRKLCEMLGYPEAELLRRNFLDLTHPADREHAAHALRGRVAEPGGLQERLEKRSVRRDGTVIWVAITAAVVRGGTDTGDYLVATVQDITERREAEARLHEQLDELRRFQAVTVDRELRMQELEAEMARLQARPREAA